MEWLMTWWNSYEATNMFRLLFASFLSGLIGIEREVHGRAAGFRTHLQENKMRIVNGRIERDAATGKSRYEYIISTNRPFDQESFISAFLVLPDIHKVNIH